jgi:hypothetical protein
VEEVVHRPFGRVLRMFARLAEADPADSRGLPDAAAKDPRRPRRRGCCAGPGRRQILRIDAKDVRERVE